MKDRKVSISETIRAQSSTYDIHTSSFLAYKSVSVATFAIEKFAADVTDADATRVVLARFACSPSAISRRTSVEPVLSGWTGICA